MTEQLFSDNGSRTTKFVSKFKLEVSNSRIGSYTHHFRDDVTREEAIQQARWGSGL